VGVTTEQLAWAAGGTIAVAGFIVAVLSPDPPPVQPEPQYDIPALCEQLCPGAEEYCRTHCGDVDGGVK